MAKMWTVLALLLGVACGGAQEPTFVNPVIAHGADPSVVMVGGMYYSVQSGCGHQTATAAVCLRAARTLAGLGKTPQVIVWTAPRNGPNTHDVWAPQIDYLGGKFYIYYAADPDDNVHHRLFALTPVEAGKPLGQWVEGDTGAPHGQLVTDWKADWAIDPDVFQASDGKFYLLYACRQDNSDTPAGNAQSICLSRMSDPLHLVADAGTGHKVVRLSLPSLDWERRGWPTQEGPFGFTHDGVDYILYSASFSGNADEYAEAMLVNEHPPQPNGVGSPMTNPAAWVKVGPIFDGHHATYGTASNVLVASPDGTELWDVYHGTDCLKNCVRVEGKTWRDRSDRAQRAGWNPRGELVLGYPVDFPNTDGTGGAVALEGVSTEGKGTSKVPAWGSAFGDAAEGDAAGGKSVGAWDSAESGDVKNVDLEPGKRQQTFFQANPNLQEYVVYTHVKATEPGAGDAHARFGVYGAYVDHANYFLAMFEGKSLATDAVVAGADKGWMTCALPTGFDAAADNVLAVEAAGGMFTVMVNDQAVSGTCQGRRAGLMAGQIATNGSNGQAGVAVEDVKAEFSDFGVSAGVPLNGRVYALRNLQSRMNLGGAGEVAIQYPAIAPYPAPIAPAEVWKLKEAGGAFQLMNGASGKCLTAEDGKAVQKGCGGDRTSRWAFVPAAGGGFMLRNEAAGTVLESPDKAQSSVMRLAARSGAAGQGWGLLAE